MSAFLAGTSDAVSKKGLETHPSPVISCVKPFWGALCLLPFLFFTKAPTDSKIFWTNVVYGIPFEVLAGLLMNRAIQISPLSQSVPYLAFTPVFLLAEGWIFLHEKPTTLGIIGVTIIACGAFFLQMESFSRDQFRLRKIFPQSKGAQMMIMVAFIFSITTIFAKKALRVSSPVRWVTIYYFLMAVGYFAFLPKGQRVKSLVNSPKLFLMIGLLEATCLVVQSTAMLMVEAAYVIAIKRLSLLFSVFYGWLFFQERDIFPRLIGAALMFIGTALLSFT